MMTFLPFADFAACAACLDMRRLQNQRTEARFVLEWLEQTGEYFDLSDYGAARMWLGFRDALVLYYNAMLSEYERRGKTNGPTLQPVAVTASAVEMPPWMGDERFHSSHRAVLLQKDATHYCQFAWKEAKEGGAEYREYLYPHRLEDDKWGLYPQSKYKKRTIVAMVHGGLVPLPDASATKQHQRSSKGKTDHEDGEAAGDGGVGDDGGAADDVGEDVPLSQRRRASKRKSREVEGDDRTASMPHVSTTPAAAAVLITPLTSAPTSAAGLSHAKLSAEYLRLTKEVLPGLAAKHKYPIRFDHCFQRVALDNAFGGCWYDFIDRKKGPAIHQIATGPLERAVEAARRMAVEGADAVNELDAKSLRWRHKQPKRVASK